MLLPAAASGIDGRARPGFRDGRKADYGRSRRFGPGRRWVGRATAPLHKRDRPADHARRTPTRPAGVSPTRSAEDRAGESSTLGERRRRWEEDWSARENNSRLQADAMQTGRNETIAREKCGQGDGAYFPANSEPAGTENFQ